MASAQDHRDATSRGFLWIPCIEKAFNVMRVGTQSRPLFLPSHNPLRFRRRIRSGPSLGHNREIGTSVIIDPCSKPNLVFSEPARLQSNPRGHPPSHRRFRPGFVWPGSTVPAIYGDVKWDGADLDLLFRRVQTRSEMSDRLTIDVVSDVICPWCYIGKRRL